MSPGPIPPSRLGEFLPLSVEQQEVISALGKGVSIILWPPRLSPKELYVLECHGRETLPLPELAHNYRRHWRVSETGEDGFVPANLPGRKWIERWGVRRLVYAVYRWVMDQIRRWQWREEIEQAVREAEELSMKLTAAGFPPPEPAIT